MGSKRSEGQSAASISTSSTANGRSPPADRLGVTRMAIRRAESGSGVSWSRMINDDDGAQARSSHQLICSRRKKEAAKSRLSTNLGDELRKSLVRLAASFGLRFQGTRAIAWDWRRLAIRRMSLLEVRNITSHIHKQICNDATAELKQLQGIVGISTRVQGDGRRRGSEADKVCEHVLPVVV
ncbi:hypothetical protein HG530_008535 [Fusarium avenaceum]|nr:hypothetical protein HG530_008535 [Fusarium avenaceum]